MLVRDLVEPAQPSHVKRGVGPTLLRARGAHFFQDYSASHKPHSDAKCTNCCHCIGLEADSRFLKSARFAGHTARGMRLMKRASLVIVSS